MTEIWKKHPKWDIELSSMGRVRRNGKIKKISHKVSYSSNAELRYGVTSVGGKRAPILRALKLIKGGRSVRSVAILVGISKSQLLRRVRAVEVMP